MVKKSEAVAEALEDRARQEVSQEFAPWIDYVFACNLYLTARNLYQAAGKDRSALRCHSKALDCQQYVNTILVN